MMNNNNNAPPFYADPSQPAPPMSGGGPAPMMQGYPMMQLPPPPPLYPPAMNNGGNNGFNSAPPLVAPQGQPVCSNCSSLGHLRRNCPNITCLACGRLGHFRQNCPTVSSSAPSTAPSDAITSIARASNSPDLARRVRTREERDTRSATDPAPQDDVDDSESNGDYRWSVCRNCGSSRHIQAQCPARYQTLECFQCHKRGHLMSSCPLTRCYNCGTYGHSSQVCHSMPHCFHCANVGHRSTECPVKTKGRICYQCNEPGHEAAHCPQGQLCRMCHQPGHLVAHCPQVTCYQCHEKGHTAGACERDQCEHCGGFHNPLTCATTADEDKIASFYRTSSESSAEAEHAEEEEDAHVTPAGSPVTAETPHSDRSDGTADVGAQQQQQQQQQPQQLEEAASTVSDQSPPTVVGSVLKSAVSERSANSSLAASPLVGLMRPYTRTGANRSKTRVALVIDGPYFERCIRRDGVEYGTELFYRHVCAALRNTLDFIGDVFEKTPIGYWFDTDPAAFTDFVETAMPLAHRERAFRESALRKRFLTDEMNSGRTLHHVLPRLVGTMKKQRGYTQDGPGHVWVQSGVDVAVATALVELFHDRRQFEQVVLLCGDSDVYPAVHSCNTQRTNNAACKEYHPVRICGTASSLAKQYGQHQDLYDFLPPILLNQPSHHEGDRTIEFPPYSAFR